MRRALYATLTLGALVLGSAGCSVSPSSSNGSGSSGSGGQAKTLTVATFQSLPPTSFQQSGQLVGWQVDLLKAAAKQMGVTVNFVPVSFDAFVPGVQSGKYDLATGVDASAAREQVIDIVSVMNAGYQFLTAKSGPSYGSNPMQLCGHSVGVVAGQSTIQYVTSLGKQCQAAGKPAVKTLTFPDDPTMYLALQSRRLDLMTSWQGGITWVIKENPQLKITGPTFNVAASGIAVAKDSALSKKLAQAVNALISDGQYQQILKKWDVPFLAINHSVVDPKVG